MLRVLMRDLHCVQLAKYHNLQVIKRAKEFQPQNISNTVWAFASLGYQPSEEFLEMVEAHLTEHIEADTLKYSCQVRPCNMHFFVTCRSYQCIHARKHQQNPTRAHSCQFLVHMYATKA